MENITKELAITCELELKKPNSYDIFYRYAIGDYKFWFSQDTKTGNIYSVYNSCSNPKFDDFEIFIDCIDFNNSYFYPNKFEFRTKSGYISVDCADEYIERLKLVTSILSAIKDFFSNSKHYKYYNKSNK